MPGRGAGHLFFTVSKLSRIAHMVVSLSVTVVSPAAEAEQACRSVVCEKCAGVDRVVEEVGPLASGVRMFL